MIFLVIDTKFPKSMLSIIIKRGHLSNQDTLSALQGIKICCMEYQGHSAALYTGRKVEFPCVSGIHFSPFLHLSCRG